VGARVEQLADRFRVVLPDLPLHGDSEDRPRHPYTLDWFAEVLGGFAAEVLGPRPLIGGHGAGAEIAAARVAAGRYGPPGWCSCPTACTPRRWPAAAPRLAVRRQGGRRARAGPRALIWRGWCSAPSAGGGEKAKAVEENCPSVGRDRQGRRELPDLPSPPSVVHWLARIKGAAAVVNGELGLLSKRSATRIEKAAAEIAAGEHDDQFPIDVFQTGSGTSSNMNANEVIATLAGEGVHANDHVNMGQSSNDVFPSAVHLAALDETNDLLPALDGLERSLAAKAKSSADVVKAGRTHLMDAVPVTLGQEFGGYAAQIARGQERVEARCRTSGRSRSAAPPPAPA
jgi:pimeloyl-ACP methyl ester carboxylesterase